MADSKKTKAIIKSSENGMRISEEERERRRQNAIKLHQDGKLGGSEFGKLGGRPRVQSANERLAESAAEDFELMREAFRSALDPSQPPYVRMQAAKEYLKIEKEWNERHKKDDDYEGDDTALFRELLSQIEKIKGSVPGELVEIESGRDAEASSGNEGVS